MGKGEQKLPKLREQTDKNFQLQGQGSYNGRGSQVTGTNEPWPSTSSPSTSKGIPGTKFVGEEDRETTRSLSESFMKDLEGREKGSQGKVLNSNFSLPQAIPQGPGSCRSHESAHHERASPSRLRYPAKSIRESTSSIEVAEDTRISWRATVALQVLSVW